MIFKLFVLVVTFHLCNGVIYHLNESEYNRMPPVFHLDPYEPCIQAGNRYCAVEFSLVSDEPSELFTMIKEYSAHVSTHFNHSELDYGICINKTCSNVLKGTTLDQKTTLEACLNESLWRDYKLKAKLIKYSCNKLNGIAEEIDTGDIIVAGLFIFLVMLHIIGSLQEFSTKETFGKYGQYLSCFSIQRNWSALVSPPDESDPLLAGMKGYYGIRVLTAVLVISCHALYPFVSNISNTQQWEEAYYLLGYLASGTVLVQTFFVLSGFLVAYHVQRYIQKRPFTWSMVARKVFQRWLRLVPSYALVLCVVATWLRLARPGPIWQRAVVEESEDCRRDWWLALLYIINYVDNSQCMIETWYLSADMQLSILGLVVIAMTKGRTRRWIIGSLIIGGLIVPAIHTYFQNLDGLIILMPQTARHLFINDPTFASVYKRTHTNVTGYAIGLCFGLVVCHMQTANPELIRKQKYRLFTWSLIVLNAALVFAGVLLYGDIPVIPIYIRVITSMLPKPMLAATVGVVLVVLALQIDNFLLKILSWEAWVSPARVSYCAYILHVTVIRVTTGVRTTLMPVTLMNFVAVLLWAVIVSFVLAVPLWLFIEAPFAKITRIVFSGDSLKNDVAKTSKVRGKKRKEVTNAEVNQGNTEKTNSTAQALNGKEKSKSTLVEANNSIEKIISIDSVKDIDKNNALAHIKNGIGKASESIINDKENSNKVEHSKNGIEKTNATAHANNDVEKTDKTIVKDEDTGKNYKTENSYNGIDDTKAAVDANNGIARTQAPVYENNNNDKTNITAKMKNSAENTNLTAHANNTIEQTNEKLDEDNDVDETHVTVRTWRQRR